MAIKKGWARISFRRFAQYSLKSWRLVKIGRRLKTSGGMRVIGRFLCTISSPPSLRWQSYKKFRRDYAIPIRHRTLNVNILIDNIDRFAQLQRFYLVSDQHFCQPCVYHILYTCGWHQLACLPSESDPPMFLQIRSSLLVMKWIHNCFWPHCSSKQHW